MKKQHPIISIILSLQSVILLCLVYFILTSCQSNGNVSPDEIKNSAEVEEKVELKVLSYNIHHANPPSRPDVIDLNAIAKVILDSKADLVGLQEVDVNTERSGTDLDQAKMLAELTGMQYYFSKSISYGGGEYGNCILSKFPILDMEKHELPYKEGTEQRALLEVTVELEDKSTLRFATTHLDFTDPNNAFDQAKALTEILENSDKPTILTGDFNTVVGSDAINYLDQYFQRTCVHDCPPTIPVTNPQRAIDFIMFSPADYYSVKTHKTIEENYASDHLPVFSILAIQ